MPDYIFQIEPGLITVLHFARQAILQSRVSIFMPPCIGWPETFEIPYTITNLYNMVAEGSAHSMRPVAHNTKEALTIGYKPTIKMNFKFSLQSQHQSKSLINTRSLNSHYFFSMAPASMQDFNKLMGT